MLPAPKDTDEITKLNEAIIKSLKEVYTIKGECIHPYSEGGREGDEEKLGDRLSWLRASYWLQP